MGISLGYRSIVSHSQFENSKITDESKNVLEAIIATGEILGVIFFTVYYNRGIKYSIFMLSVTASMVAIFLGFGFTSMICY